jgi:two-component system chemotaxis response regulator CheB
LRHVHVDHCVKLADLADLIARLAAAPAGRPPAIPEDIRLEAEIAERGDGTIETEQRLGRPSPFSCPDCGGVLWQIEDGALPRYRCHTGHGYTTAALAAGQSAKLEGALASALRGHRERAELFRRMAENAHAADGDTTERRLRERAEECERQAQLIVDFLERDHALAPV